MKKKNIKKGAIAQLYDVQAAPLAFARDKSQEAESTSGQGSQAESFSCDKCSEFCAA